MMMELHLCCSVVFYLLAVITIINVDEVVSLTRRRNVYQKISEDEEMSSFNELLRGNRIARLDLNYKAVTVFVPANSAFERFNGMFDQELSYYHISYEVKTLRQLLSANKLTSTKEIFPPLWIAKQDRRVYVNNANIIEEKSDYLGKTRDDDSGEIQILHVLDEVLDPVIRNSTIEPTAHQLLATPDHWRISHTLDMFYERVTDTGLNHLYEKNGGHTFFIPVDKNIDDYRYNLLDNYTIQGHVIPNQVLFTRPASKHFLYETACNGDYIYVLDSFIEDAGKVVVKSTTILGDSNHPKGETIAEIVYPNLPVKNGVVHLISKPLMIFERELKPFPFLSVFYKLSSDPYLDYSYRIGENTALNAELQDPGMKITYFVPRNKAWKTAFEKHTYSLNQQRDILSRHIVKDETAYTMERLVHLSNSSYNGSIFLQSVGGPVMLNVLFFDNSYFINFNGTFIRVYRVNYQCNDGVVHVLDAPFLYELEKDMQYLHPNAYDEEGSDTTESSWNFWGYLKDVLT